MAKLFKTYEHLTWKIFEDFGDRKNTGFIALIIDVKTGYIYIVPHELEHIEFVSRLLDIDKKEIKKKPNLLENLIPSNININEEKKVDGIITGISGMEMGYGVRHSKESLEKAHIITHNFINIGEIPKKERLNYNKIIFKYSIN